MEEFKKTGMGNMIMDFSNYVTIVTVVAIFYSFLIREIQTRFGNQEEMKKFQEESKKLNDELKDAMKRKDDKKVEQINKEQMELFPKMSKMMIGQFKTVGIVLVVFFIFNWGVTNFDPTTKDDITLQLKDDGKNCDGNANDLIYGVCFTPSTTEGPWTAHVKAHQNNNIVGENYSEFLVGKSNNQAYLKPAKGDAISVNFNKKQVNLNEEVELTVKPLRADRVEITLDNGTWFYVDLPFTIPILNITRINDSYWWFIFVAILSGLILNPIIAKIKSGANKK